MDKAIFLSLFLEASAWAHRIKQIKLSAVEQISVQAIQGRLNLEITKLKDEITKIETSELKFYLHNILFFFVAIASSLDKVLTASKVETRAKRTTPFISENVQANLKIISQKEGLQAYLNPRLELSYLGMLMIADYYNHKYFSAHPCLFLTPSYKVCLEKIRLACQIEHDFRLGLITFSSPQSLDSEAPTAHPIPLVLERYENQLYLFISDGSYQENNLACSLFLKKQLWDVKINYLMSELNRQADNGSCRSEALVFLKNTIQMPKGLIQFIIIRSQLDARTYSYLDAPDMLKTSQKSKNFNHIDEDTKLYSTKKKLGFFEKIHAYRHPTVYLRQDLITHQDFFAKTGAEMIEAIEHSYLLQKTWRHHRILETITGHADFSTEQVDNVIAAQDSFSVFELK